MKASKVLPPLLSSFLLGSSCQYDPHVSDFTTSKPTQSVAGIYLPTTETLSFIKQRHYSPNNSYIKLCPNGAFIFSHVPDMWNTPFGNAKGGFDSSSGQWLVQPHQEWWAVTLNFDNVQNFHSEKYKNGFTTQADIIGAGQP